MHVVVVGAGVAGLGTALAVARAGHDVTVLERDATPLPTDADAAFAWDRRGAPQVRHSHALLARLRNLLRDRYPEVLADLLAAGATELRFTENFPPDIDDPSPQPGDEDLVALACRRTTFEWVLRRNVLAHDHVALRDGVVVDGLAVDAAVDRRGGRPHVSGVRLGDGEVVDADLVVAANGRRSPVPAWLAEHGVSVPEVTEDTGIIYFSRFYRLADQAALPDQTGPIGGDLTYLKYAIFQGDNDTWSVTFAIPVGDDTLRTALLDAERFDAAGAALPATAPWVDPAVAVPITDVHVMAKLLNRHRRFVDEDGAPLVTGFSAVGDAHTCTNPLYGRGCSLGMVQATLVADALASHPADPVARAGAYEAACAREIEPWYHAAVMQDAGARAALAGDGAAADEASPMARMMRDGLLPAMRAHAHVLRAFLRTFNLLDTPDAVFTDEAVVAAVLEMVRHPERRPPAVVLGPERSTLLEALA